MSAFHFGSRSLFILDPDHYRDDGSCKCDDAEYRKMMIKKWGYTESHFKGIELRQ